MSMKTLKRNLLPLACCLLYGIDRIGRPMTVLSGIALGMTALYLLMLAMHMFRKGGE